AYAQLLTGEFDLALTSIDECEAVFASRGDILNQARCKMRRSSILRRQDHYDRSLENLLETQEVFLERPAPIDAAKVQYQLAYLDLFDRNNYKEAEDIFLQARRTFVRGQMPLWVGLCDHALGQVYLESGSLSKANHRLEQAKTVLADFDITGALGDVLFDRAKYARLVGDHPSSVKQLREAMKCYDQVGAPTMSVLATMHLGSTYREWGFYQLALHYLEQAQEQLVEMNQPGRLAECHMRLAHVWLQLNRPEEANACLELALRYYEAVHRPAYLITVFGRQAEVAMLTENNDRAIGYLEQALELAHQHDLSLQIAIAQRLLGECLCQSGQAETGLRYLQQATEKFAEMGLVFDKAGCLVSLGNGLMDSNEPNMAQKAWQNALELDLETVPAITWRARGGLARVAARRENHKEALRQYRLAIQALNRQRRDFWQPDIAGTFLQKASSLINEAVVLAVDKGADEQALQFVEAGKAQSVVRRFLRAPNNVLRKTPSSELRMAAAEIQTIYEHLQVRYEKVRFRQSPEVSELMRTLFSKIESYRAASSRWERQQFQDFGLAVKGDLDIGRFYQTGQAKLNHPLVALSYFLTDEQLCIVAVMDGVCRTWKRPITARIRFAMESCLRARTNFPKPTSYVLQTLGEWLIPDEIAAKITSDTFLLIAPHKTLHQLPWAALIISQGGRPLVTNCIPVLVPSLTCLSLLWERAALPLPLEEGLLIGASKFPGRSRQPLPEVDKELSYLTSKLSGSGKALIGQEATWQRLSSLAGRKGLSDFSFCHIAGHASFDSLTGHLSGISFYDRDVWLDELWNCSPWPPLVTMAACNSGQSLIHEGDEHIGLTTTLLAAGANTVVGSLWPVQDEGAARLLTAFYDYFLAGHLPSSALALAQRLAVREGQEVTHWGSFISVGQP
ncbi:MAG: CHAT domain-containing tetratricopeptide repeat protein, partial [Candidatus Promineifilaceae bacterium]